MNASSFGGPTKLSKIQMLRCSCNVQIEHWRFRKAVVSISHIRLTGAPCPSVMQRAVKLVRARCVGWCL